MILQTLLLLACQIPSTTQEPVCDPRLLDMGEVRIRRIPCQEELMDGGHGRQGDWLLENSQVRAIIRTGAPALSTLYAPAGGVIDFAPVEQADELLELLPQAAEEWPEPTSIEAFQTEDLVRLLVTYEEQELQYTLLADDNKLQLAGTADWLLTSSPDTQQQDVLLVPAEQAYAYATDGQMQQQEGRFQITNPTFIVADTWESIYRRVSPNSKWIELETTGDWLELFADQQHVASLPIDNEYAEGWIPEAANGWRRRQEGCELRPPQPFSTSPPLGDCGTIMLRVQDESGKAIPAQLHTIDGIHTIPSNGRRVALRPSIQSAKVFAGPNFQQYELTDLRPALERSYSIQLSRIISHDLLFQPRIRTHPDQQLLTSSQQQLLLAAAEGVDHAILFANNIVPDRSLSLEQPWQEHIDKQMAVQHGNDSYWIQSWPWSQQLGSGAFGAPPLVTTDPHLHFAYAARGNRFTMVNTEWIQMAGEVWSWPQKPDFVWLSDPSDLSTYYNLLDQRVAISPLGPSTWALLPEDASRTDMYAHLLEQNVSLGNGPWIAVGFRENGMLLSGARKTISIEVRAPEWMKVKHVRLIGEGGQILQEWPMTGETWLQSVWLPSQPWLVVEVHGDQDITELGGQPAWAISAPIWIQ